MATKKTHCACGRAKQTKKATGAKRTKAATPAGPKPVKKGADPEKVKDLLAQSIEKLQARAALEEQLANLAIEESSVVKELFAVAGHGGPFEVGDKTYRVRRGGDRHWLKLME